MFIQNLQHEQSIEELTIISIQNIMYMSILHRRTKLQDIRNCGFKIVKNIKIVDYILN